MEEPNAPKLVLTQDWPWVYPTLTISLKRELDTIKSIEIDPSKRMVDIQVENNKWSFKLHFICYVKKKRWVNHLFYLESTSVFLVLYFSTDSLC